MRRNKKRAVSLIACLALTVQAGAVTAYANEAAAPVSLSKIAGYTSGQYNVDGGVMEIIAYNTATDWAYAVNGQTGMLTAISMENLTANGFLELTGTEIDVKGLVENQDAAFSYGDMTSVAVSPDGTLLAAALQSEGYNDSGRAAIFGCSSDGSLTLRGIVETGIQPDMIVFADNGTILTADEGEPREGYGNGAADPRGSVTIINAEELTGTVVGFDGFDSEEKRAALVSSGIVLKKNTAPSVDLEPEYIAVSDGKAYVTLQEANAIAVLNLADQSFEGIYSAGFEDYSVSPVDIDKKDDAYVPKTYGSLRGIRMPDGITAWSVNGTTYLAAANEGDGREWGDEDLGTFYLNEEEREFGEDETSPTGAITASGSGLEGKVTFFKSSDYDGLDGTKDYLFGGRTFTVYAVREDGLQEIFTSGDDFEALTAAAFPEYYNCSNDNAVLDDRSGKKGPEPESVTVGSVNGRTYVFTALERTGGVMVYDVTDPERTAYAGYINSRDFASIVDGSQVYEDGELDKWVTGGDVAPEGLAFIPAEESPTGNALLLAACEVSGTVAVYQIP